jgi:hypothetical protein
MSKVNSRTAELVGHTPEAREVRAWPLESAPMLMKHLKREAVDWPVFSPSSAALGLDRIRLKGGKHRTWLTSNGRALFGMDDDQVRDLIDTLQKYLDLPQLPLGEK